MTSFLVNKLFEVWFVKLNDFSSPPRENVNAIVQWAQLFFLQGVAFLYYERPSEHK